MTDQDPEAIAIVGMSCRFPGAQSPEQFFDNLLNGIESLTPRRHWYEDAPRPVPAADRAGETAVGMIPDIGHLDAGYFGLTPREAEVMDPQIRLFLECAAEALQRAGHDGNDPETRVGVYAGVGINTYYLRHVLPNPRVMQGANAFQAIASNEKDFVATQTSYRLDLRGPSLSIHTACSTSLVAVVQAIESLLSYQCDVALAGASSIKPDPAFGYFLEEGNIGSKDSICRAFDAGANGTVAGSGTGVVALKRLSDALADGDPIHAVIKGAATNNDGAAKTGYTAPSIEGQSTVVSEALAVAGIEPDTIGYIETHGTGTPVGDPIEVTALHRALGAGPPNSIALGAVKTNIGHLDAAAGVAGLIKAALAVEHGTIPPTLHFQTPNPALRLTETRFHVPTAPVPFPSAPGTPRRAGVSSFGIGGTNAHVILEQAPPAAPRPEPSAAPQLITLSARSASALEASVAALATHLETEAPALEDAAWTLQTGRKRHGHRRSILAKDRTEAIEILRGAGPARRTFAHSTDAKELDVAFLLPGQGAQHIHMAQALYQNEPTFREHFDECAGHFALHGVEDLSALLYPAAGTDLAAATARLNETQQTQPALFAVEYALARLWMHWGIEPRALLGHSLGELVAATLAGVFELADATRIVAARARLMQNTPEGRMLAISAEAETVQALLEADASIAAINAPGTCVASGSPAGIEQLHARLENQGIEARLLHVTRAFHSPLVDGALEDFEAIVRSAPLQAPTIPIISNQTGAPLTDAQAKDPMYWVQHVRQPVDFAKGVAHLLEQPGLALLEVGPGRTLSSLAQRQLDPATKRAPILTSLGHPKDNADDAIVLREALARLWNAGATPNWPQVHQGPRPRRVQLPTYPWEKRRYWLPAQEAGIGKGEDTHETDAPTPETGTGPFPATNGHTRPDLPVPYAAATEPLEEALVEIWENILGFQGIGIHDDFFDLGGHSLIATKMVAHIRETFDVEVALPRLFEVRTIYELSQAVEALLMEKLEGMTDEEAARLAQ